MLKPYRYIPIKLRYWLYVFILLHSLAYMGGMDNFLIMADIRLHPLYPYGLYAVVPYALIGAYIVPKVEGLKPIIVQIQKRKSSRWVLNDKNSSDGIVTMLTAHFVALIITAISQFILALFVISKGKNKLTNVTYALYSTAIALWSGGEAFAVISKTPDLALFFGVLIMWA